MLESSDSCLIPTHTSVQNRCWCHDGMMACQLMLIVEFLWPLRINLASFAKSIWESKQGLPAHLCTSHCQDSIIFRHPVGVGLALAAGGKGIGVGYATPATQSNREGVLQLLWQACWFHSVRTSLVFLVCCRASKRASFPNKPINFQICFHVWNSGTEKLDKRW